MNCLAGCQQRLKKTKELSNLLCTTMLVKLNARSISQLKQSTCKPSKQNHKYHSKQTNNSPSPQNTHISVNETATLSGSLRSTKTLMTNPIFAKANSGSNKGNRTKFVATFQQVQSMMAQTRDLLEQSQQARNGDVLRKALELRGGELRSLFGSGLLLMQLLSYLAGEFLFFLSRRELLNLFSFSLDDDGTWFHLYWFAFPPSDDGGWCDNKLISDISNEIRWKMSLPHNRRTLNCFVSFNQCSNNGFELESHEFQQKNSKIKECWIMQQLLGLSFSDTRLLASFLRCSVL